MHCCMYIPVGNITPGEFQSYEAITEMAQALEQAKIEACCVTDHPAPSSKWLHANGHDALDPFAALAFIAACSQRLLLQTNILVLPYRNPFLTAKGAASLQVLSGGRFILGVGAGYQEDEFKALGVDFSQRGRLTDEAINTIKAIWHGGPVVAQGLQFNAPGNEPRPAPNPPPKIWVGGSSQAAMRRAADVGDGWCPFFAIAKHSKANQQSGLQSIKDLQDKIQWLRQRREKAGLSDTFDINVAINSTDLVVDLSASEAREYAEKLLQLREIGVNWVTVKLPHPNRAAYLEAVQWFARDVRGEMGEPINK